jgi:hypothetical protein
MVAFLDVLSPEEFAALAARNEAACVSVYLPVHPSGREVQQDGVRLRGLLGRAREALRARGLAREETQALIAPGEALLEDSEFWARRARGIVFLSGRGWSRHYRLPLAFPELAMVGERPYLKPLFPLFCGDGRFYVLGLAQKQPALYRGARFQLERLEHASLPESLQAALQPDERASVLHFEGRAPHHTGSLPQAFHGQSVGSPDDNDPIVRYLRTIDQALHPLLRTEHAPLVLEGVDYVMGLYRAVNTYPHLVEGGIRGSPGGRALEELHAEGWALVEPHFTRAQREARARFEQLRGQQAAGRGGVRALEAIADTVSAACAGRIDALFVALDRQAWGRFHAREFVAELHPDREPGDEDLLDRAAIETFNTGGSVFALPAEHVPGRGAVAAVLRY